MSDTLIPHVASGHFDKQSAEALLEAASECETLGYPTVSVFEVEGSDLWKCDIYLQEEIAVSELVALLGEKASALTVEALPQDVDWVLEGLREQEPVEIGRFFVHGSHDADKVRPYHIPIEINAAQAFGTGHHGTTAGCLEAIDMLLKRGLFYSVLDLGAGTGVLAFAVAKAQKDQVLATDIDPVAVRVMKENARLNGIAPLIKGEVATGFGHPVFSEEGPFDLIIANILAGPLTKLAKPISDHVALGGYVILSGLLVHQIPWVLSAYRAQDFVLRKVIRREGWATLVLQA